MTYQDKIQAWRQLLEDQLRAENSWLALAGLFWLAPGQNRVGSGLNQDIVLPGQTTPKHLGTFVLSDGIVALNLPSKSAVKVDGVSVTGTAEIIIQPDTSSNPTMISRGDLTMMIIKRAETYGLRLWDNSRPERQSFSGRQWYPIQTDYCFQGHYQDYNELEQITISRTLGPDVEVQVRGVVSFVHAGESYRLLALEAPDGKLSLPFRDQTNGQQTYPAGRYLVVDSPQAGVVTLDFNRAYNPPCAFTAYATCPLPPPQNHLPLPIEAGEQYT